MKRSILSCALLLGCLTTTISAQQPENENQSPKEQVIREFDRTAPKVGQKIPEILLLDARGKPIATTELCGNYTVLVFGCLT